MHTSQPTFCCSLGSLALAQVLASLTFPPGSRFSLQQAHADAAAAEAAAAAAAGNGDGGAAGHLGASEESGEDGRDPNREGEPGEPSPAPQTQPLAAVAAEAAEGMPAKEPPAATVGPLPWPEPPAAASSRPVTGPLPGASTGRHGYDQPTASTRMKELPSFGRPVRGASAPSRRLPTGGLAEAAAAGAVTAPAAQQAQQLETVSDGGAC